MTLKLMKYELKAMLRTFIPLWCVILVLSLVNRLTLRIDGLAELWHGIPAGLMLFAYAISILAAYIIAVVFLILRFYHGLLRDEGYLMFTLPVKTWQLICSKMFSAVILLVGTSLIALLSVMVLIVDNEVIKEIGELIKVMATYDTFPFRAEFIWKILVMAIIAAVISPFTQILQCYLSMAIGQLANRSKVGCSVLSYIGISLTVSFLTNIAVTIPMVARVQEIEDSVTAATDFMMATMMSTFGTMLIVEILLVAAFYVPTWWILKNKLNLE